MLTTRIFKYLRVLFGKTEKLRSKQKKTGRNGIKIEKELWRYEGNNNDKNLLVFYLNVIASLPVFIMCVWHVDKYRGEFLFETFAIGVEFKWLNKEIHPKNNK